MAIGGLRRPPSSQGQFRREQETLSLALVGRGDMLWGNSVPCTSLRYLITRHSLPRGLGWRGDLLNRAVTLSKVIQKV